MSLKQQVQQPVVCIRRPGRWNVNQKLCKRIGITDYAHLSAKLIPIHLELYHGAVDECFKSICPFSGCVVPEDEAMALEDTLKTVVNSSHVNNVSSILTCG